MRYGTFAAIDVGTTKICTIVGEVAPGTGETRILGVGVTPSAGLSRGMVDNIREATDAIRASVEKAERASGTRILSAHVGLSGAHVQSVNNRGIVAVPDRNRPISGDDIARALEGAKIISIPSNREILHVLPRYFVVDGQDSVSDPLGMYGSRLDVEAHIITVASSAVANVSKVVEAAGVQVDELVLQPLASAESVLNPEEKRQGVVIADIGGGCTDISVFLEGAIHHTATLPVGGNHITRDLVVGLRCPYHSAELAKEEFGVAIPSAVPADETIEIEAFGAERQRSYPRRLVCEIIQARCEEILEMIIIEVKKSTELEFVSAGLVLTGGTARLPGLDILAEQVTGLPARVGLPEHIFGLVDELHDPAFATSVGLLQWAVGDQDLAPVQRHAAGPSAFDGLFKRISNWVRVLLPE
ncbi:MAG TPA: cell division protein FtsA [Dehalococcoidia bacterium]|nr:cell division protein FtsA [Dehalococcoidia bacterium]